MEKSILEVEKEVLEKQKSNLQKQLDSLLDREEMDENVNKMTKVIEFWSGVGAKAMVNNFLRSPAIS